MSRRILLVGDSHVHAIQDAIAARGAEGTAVPIEALRLLKSKGSAADDQVPKSPLARTWDRLRKRLKPQPGRADRTVIGDISLEDSITLSRRLGPDDVLVSVVGGSQHAVFSTIQHPEPFDFLFPGGSDSVAEKAEIIPFRTLYGFFLSWLAKGNGNVIAALRKSTDATMIHLLPPPPKRENDYIENYHDTRFAEEGITDFGVSSPDLRMKFWQLQNRAIADIAEDLGVEVIAPPAEACDPDGFLQPRYFAGDATHANIAYGELVIQQLERRFADAG